jgi:transcription factor IIIB subunit 2
MKCPACGSRDIDFHESGGHSYCVSCGNLVEENAIVSSIEFQENGDRSQVIGQFVSANCSRPYSSSNRAIGRFGSGRDSREAKLYKVKTAISQIASALGLPDDGIVERALRLYQLAMDNNFVFGRKQLHVASTCLYTTCRLELKPHLLLDFSEALQVNVYALGQAYMQFKILLSLNIPNVDPAIFLPRYALRLDLEDRKDSVVLLALQLVSRFKKDWITLGRKPNNICAAAMLISARSHGFPLTQSEIAKTFQISGDTLMKRLREFRSTPSAMLTMKQFYQNDEKNNIEFDPPVFINNLIKDAETERLKSGFEPIFHLSLNGCDEETGEEETGQETDETVHRDGEEFKNVKGGEQAEKAEEEEEEKEKEKDINMNNENNMQAEQMPADTPQSVTERSVLNEIQLFEKDFPPLQSSLPHDAALYELHHTVPTLIGDVEVQVALPSLAPNIR